MFLLILSKLGKKLIKLFTNQSFRGSALFYASISCFIFGYNLAIIIKNKDIKRIIEECEKK